MAVGNGSWKPADFGWAGDIAKSIGIGGLWLIDRFAEQRGLVPVLEDQVVVEVTGQPGANKQQLYFLTLAVANGIVPRFGALFNASPSFGQLTIEYDAASNWVRATLAYRWSMNATVADGITITPSGIGNSILGLVRIGDVMDQMAVYRGPQCDVNGGKFNFQVSTSNFPGIPNPTALPPTLPFEGQPILTACPTTPQPKPKDLTVSPAPDAPLNGAGSPMPSPNPKPPGDNRSRGAVIDSNTRDLSTSRSTASGFGCCPKVKLLIPLVFAALTEAGTNANMTYPAPVTSNPAPNSPAG